ncbi:MAG: acylphosphatase [Pirellulales bacterium]
MADTRVKTKVLYSGRVQGVGFRASTAAIAEGFAVGGYVRNLPDGRVEAVVEGPTDEVAACIDGDRRPVGPLHS